MKSRKPIRKSRKSRKSRGGFKIYVDPEDRRGLIKSRKSRKLLKKLPKKKVGSPIRHAGKENMSGIDATMRNFENRNMMRMR
jgi:hypothetical protein